MRRLLWILVLALAALPAAAQRRPLYTDSTNYSYGGPCAYPSDAWIFNSATGNCYRCVSSVWVSCSFPAAPVSSGPADSVQVGNGAGSFAGESGFRYSLSGDLLTLQGGQLWDTNENGTARLAVCGDVDGNGTYNATDCTSCRSSYQTALCVASELGVDMDGDGSPNAALWDSGSARESGLVLHGALAAEHYFLTENPLGRTDLDLDGTQRVVAMTPNLGLQAAIQAHAALYGEVEPYLQPAIIPAYQGYAFGRPLYADCDNDGTTGGPTTTGVNDGECGPNAEVRPAISACATACTSDLKNICVTTSDPTNNNALDSNGDGTVDFAVGDLVVFSNAVNKAASPKTYSIVSFSNGGVCPAGNDGNIALTEAVNQNTISGPDQNADGTVDAGMTIARVWANNSHPSRPGAHGLGLFVGYQSRSEAGYHGRNLLLNGDADYDATMQGWTASPTASVAFGAQSFTATPNTGSPAFTCIQGGTNACFFITGTVGGYVESTSTIPVQPGQRYVLTLNWIAQDANDEIGLADDRDRNGVWTVDSALKRVLTTAESDANFDGWLRPIYATWEIPEGVHEVRVRITKGGSATMAVDQIALRRLTTIVGDTWTDTETSTLKPFVIADPGDYQICAGFDSWTAASTGPGDNFKIGLADALAARYPHKSSATWQSQITLAGVGGYSTSDVLANWASLVTRHACIYTIVILGTNDVYGGLAEATWTARNREIMALLKRITIPVVVEILPLGPTGNARMTTTRQFNDARRRALFQGPEPQGGALTRDEFETLTYVENDIIANTATAMGAHFYSATHFAIYQHLKYSGRMEALECTTNAALTAGTLTFVARINNGSNSDLTVVLNSTPGTGGAADDSVSDFVCTSNCEFTPADKIQMRITSDVAYLPVTADQLCWLRVRYYDR